MQDSLLLMFKPGVINLHIIDVAVLRVLVIILASGHSIR